jgi:hypothetical protein
MIDVNIKGVLYGIAAALPLFQRQGSGHIINVVSTAGLKILPSMGVYAATKNAVRTITEALRQEAGPHLRVTEVSPGFVATDFVESITDKAVKAAIKQRGAGMAIPPEAIARGILFAIEQPDDVDVGSIVIRPTGPRLKPTLTRLRVSLCKPGDCPQEASCRHQVEAAAATEPSIPGFAIAERPIRAINIDHVDHDIVGTNGQLVLQLVGEISEEGQLRLLVVPDCWSPESRGSRPTVSSRGSWDRRSGCRVCAR